MAPAVSTTAVCSGCILGRRRRCRGARSARTSLLAACSEISTKYRMIHTGSASPVRGGAHIIDRPPPRALRAFHRTPQRSAWARPRRTRRERRSASAGADQDQWFSKGTPARPGTAAAGAGVSAASARARCASRLAACAHANSSGSGSASQLDPWT